MALLWRILSWCTRKPVTLKACLIPGRLNVQVQAIQTWPDHSNGVVPSPIGVLSYIILVASAPSGVVCHQIQQQTPTVCVTSSRPQAWAVDGQSVLGKSGPICLPTSSHLGQSGGEVTRLPLQQNHSDCTRVAQHALVLGSSGNVQSDPSVSAQPTQSGISTIQPDPAQEPVKPEPTCLAPRATAIKEQGFSETVAAQIEAPQRGSTRKCFLVPKYGFSVVLIHFCPWTLNLHIVIVLLRLRVHFSVEIKRYKSRIRKVGHFYKVVPQ